MTAALISVPTTSFINNVRASYACTARAASALRVCLVWLCRHRTLVPEKSFPVSCSPEPCQLCATAGTILSGETWSFDYLPHPCIASSSSAVSLYRLSMSAPYPCTRKLTCCSLDPSQVYATAGTILSGETWSFDYLPGAGDDEESWARRLTPGVLWRHRDELVSAGPAGVQPLVSQLSRGVSSGALGQDSSVPHAHVVALSAKPLCRSLRSAQVTVTCQHWHSGSLPMQGLRRIPTDRCPARGPLSRMRTQLSRQVPYPG